MVLPSKHAKTQYRTYVIIGRGSKTGFETKTHLDISDQHLLRVISPESVGGRPAIRHFLTINHLSTSACSPQFWCSNISWRTTSPSLPLHSHAGAGFLDLHEEGKCLHLVGCLHTVCRLSNPHRTPVPDSCLVGYLASLRGGSTISPAGYKKQFLPLDLGAPVAYDMARILIGSACK